MAMIFTVRMDTFQHFLLDLSNSVGMYHISTAPDSVRKLEEEFYQVRGELIDEGKALDERGMIVRVEIPRDDESDF